MGGLGLGLDRGLVLALRRIAAGGLNWSDYEGNRTGREQLLTLRRRAEGVLLVNVHAPLSIARG